MKKCVIFYNEEKKSAVLYYNQIKDFLEEEGVLILSSCDIKKADFAVVIGGDGTLLRASQKIIPNENIVVIAVNAGSLGFLTEVRGEEGVEEGRGNDTWEHQRENQLESLPLVHPSRACLAPECRESFASSPLALGEPNSVLFTQLCWSGLSSSVSRASLSAPLEAGSPGGTRSGTAN